MHNAAGCWKRAVSCVAVLQTVCSERYAPRRPEVTRSARSHDKQQRSTLHKEEASVGSHRRCVSRDRQHDNTNNEQTRSVLDAKSKLTGRHWCGGLRHAACGGLSAPASLRQTHAIRKGWGSSTCSTFLISLITISSPSLPWALLGSSSKTFSYASRAAPRLLSPWFAAPTREYPLAQSGLRETAIIPSCRALG